MNLKVNEKVIKETNEIWGKDYISTLGMEEFAEVIQAINKIRRFGLDKESSDHLNEEIADCIIIIHELLDMGWIDEHEIQLWINYKQARQSKRNKNREDK